MRLISLGHFQFVITKQSATSTLISSMCTKTVTTCTFSGKMVSIKTFLGTHLLTKKQRILETRLHGYCLESKQFMQPCVHILAGLRGMTNVCSTYTEEVRNVLWQQSSTNMKVLHANELDINVHVWFKWPFLFHLRSRGYSWILKPYLQQCLSPWVKSDVNGNNCKRKLQRQIVCVSMPFPVLSSCQNIF